MLRVSLANYKTAIEAIKHNIAITAKEYFSLRAYNRFCVENKIDVLNKKEDIPDTIDFSDEWVRRILRDKESAMFLVIIRPGEKPQWICQR